MALALIPARAGSKGIPNKNLAPLGDKPLLHYTIEAAKQAACVDSIVLSSDGDAILEYGRTQGIKVLQRPKELALDSTTSDKVVAHALQHYACETLILLQPTSPLRSARHIDEAFERFTKEGSEALISVTQCDNAILSACVESATMLIPLCHAKSSQRLTKAMGRFISCRHAHFWTIQASCNLTQATM